MAESVGLKESCAVHPQRPAVERCARCGRAACLQCAIPVRGQVFGAECVGGETGSPVPPRASERPRARTDVAAVVLFVLGVGASAFPWDRFGNRTGPFSAWNPVPEPWPLLASVSLLVGAALALVLMVRPEGRLRHLTSLWSAGAGGVAVIASAIALVAVPGHATRTLWPAVALVAALGATTLVTLRVRRASA
ncbi:MAG: hypothetical protein ACRDH6_03000 [Actinomycetota bacterium]